MVDSSNALIKTGISVLIILMALPGVVFEPGPLSEIVAVGAVGTVWGVDFGVGDG